MWPLAYGACEYPAGRSMMVFRFELPQKTDLTDIRFNGVEVFSAISKWRYLHTYLRVEVSWQQEAEREHQRYTKKLKSVCLDLVQFLEDVWYAYPNRRAMQCPTIWIDGRGSIREAQFGLAIHSAEPARDDTLIVDETMISEINMKSYGETEGAIWGCKKVGAEDSLDATIRKFFRDYELIVFV